MPIYELSCEECGNEEERIVPYAAGDTQECECGTIMKRKISVPGYVWAPTRSKK